MEQFSQGYWEATSQVWVFNISTKENNSTYRLWLFFFFQLTPRCKGGGWCLCYSQRQPWTPPPDLFLCQKLPVSDLMWSVFPMEAGATLLPAPHAPTHPSFFPASNSPGATLPPALLTGLNVSEESLCRTLQTHRDSYKWPSLMFVLSHFSPTLCDPTGCSPPGSSVHEILQARILEWVAMPSSRGSSPPRDRIHIA